MLGRRPRRDSCGSTRNISAADGRGSELSESSRAELPRRGPQHRPGLGVRREAIAQEKDKGQKRQLRCSRASS